MLQITNTVLSKEATAKVGESTYALNYVIQNDSLKTITCSVSKNTVIEQETPEGNQLIEVPQHIGYLRMENNRLVMDFESTIDPTEFIRVFKEMEKELDSKSVTITD